VGVDRQQRQTDPVLGAVVVLDTLDGDTACRSLSTIGWS